MRNVYDFWDKLSEEQKAGVREVERKYGDNKWWESKDPLVIIEHQLKERFFMMSFPEYKDALERLTERPVCHLDFAFNNSRVVSDAESAIKRKKAGVGQSDGQKEAARRDYIKRVEDIAKQLPNSIVVRKEKSDQRDSGNGIDSSGYDGWLNK